MAQVFHSGLALTDLLEGMASQIAGAIEGQAGGTWHPRRPALLSGTVVSAGVVPLLRISGEAASLLPVLRWLGIASAAAGVLQPGGDPLLLPGGVRRLAWLGRH